MCRACSCLRARACRLWPGPLLLRSHSCALAPQTVLWHLSGDHAASGLPGSDGAVLVFLPGVAEIDNVRAAILESRLVRSLSTGEGGDAGQQAAWILPLHGSLPPDEQRRVFDRPPAGVTKVVLATNVTAADSNPRRSQMVRTPCRSFVCCDHLVRTPCMHACRPCTYVVSSLYVCCEHSVRML